jgi:hypothetical protein
MATQSFGGFTNSPTTYTIPSSGGAYPILIVASNGLNQSGTAVSGPNTVTLSTGVQLTQIIAVGSSIGAAPPALFIWFTTNVPLDTPFTINCNFNSNTLNASWASHYYGFSKANPGQGRNNIYSYSGNNYIDAVYQNSINPTDWVVGFTNGSVSTGGTLVPYADAGNAPGTPSMTNRYNTSGVCLSDTNGPNVAGVYAFDTTIVSPYDYSIAGFTLSIWNDLVVSDATSVSDAPYLQLNPVHLSVSDSTAASDTITMAREGALADLLGSMISSSYKWLTSTLLTAQQQFAVRPYFTAQIIDDTIQPLGQLTGSGGVPLGNGSMAVAPDGTAFSVGLDASNNLCVFNDANLNVGTPWPNKTILNTSGDNFLNAANVYSIGISGYYKGKYRICVWYYGNFVNDGSNLTIKLQYSDDGGQTFTKVTYTPANLPNNSIGNLSIASMAPIWSGGNLNMGCFYIKPNGNTFNSGFTGYDIYYIYGNSGGYSTDILWTQNANSYDWTIHSIGAFYLKGVQYCVFSGFRNVLDTPGTNQNYSIWVTAILNLTTSTFTDLWKAPISIMPVSSASSINMNSFTFPTGNVVNNQAYITMNADLVDSVSQTSQGSQVQVVTTHTNYMMIQSDDGEGFSYPSVFVDPNGAEFNNLTYASFVLQNGFWYLGGANGFLWQYIQNNITADVSADTIGYQLQDVAGQPGSISLQIANANGKWVGGSPTGPGAAAIASNRKIAIWQGYYNTNEVVESVPHSVYYIDDVQQSVTGTTNDVTLVGRDFYKKMITTVSKFAYQYLGPLFFTDIFDGTFTSNWNQANGMWTFEPQNAGTPPFLNLTTAAGGESNIFYNGTNANSYGHLMRIFFRSTANIANTSHVYIYGFYIDANNWLRLDINTGFSTWQVVLNTNGSAGAIDSGSLPSALMNSGSSYYGVYVRRYDYFKFNFMIDMLGDGIGNTIFDYAASTTSYVFKNVGTGEYDLTSNFASNTTLQTPYTVGFGTINNGPSQYRWFTYTQLNAPNNLGSLVRRLSRIAGIFSYKITYTWRELLFNPNFSGAFNVLNRILSLASTSRAMSNVNSMGDGEISFMAKMTVTDNTLPAGFSFIFRNSPDANGFNDNYNFHAIQASTGLSNPPSFFRFERYVQEINYPIGTIFKFYNTPYDVNNNQSALGSPNINLTQWNKFRVVMIGGWFWAYVNDVMIASWNDNNTTITYQTTGTWGFQTDTNTTLQVQKITAPNFWKPVQAFSVNPGDDIETDVTTLLQTLRAWVFSDLLGRFKMVFLSSNDQSTYTYDLQLSQQNTDNSDKEYAAQVTVYGNGVSATARNTMLMAGVQTRDLVVVDYTITTQADAQTRANNELATQGQYLNQYTPKQIINVGAELFDAITVVNTGNNTTGISGPTRSYGNTFTEGGGNNNGDYTIEIDTGNL